MPLLKLEGTHLFFTLREEGARDELTVFINRLFDNDADFFATSVYEKIASRPAVVGVPLEEVFPWIIS